MSKTTIPYVVFEIHDKTVKIHPVDLKSITTCMVISPEFLSSIAKHDKGYIRAIAAEHVNTPPDVLKEMLKDKSMVIHYAALENPQTPFKAVLLEWHKKIPGGTVWDSPAVLERKEELLQLLSDYDITEEESKTLPARWIVNILKP